MKGASQTWQASASTILTFLTSKVRGSDGWSCSLLWPGGAITGDATGALKDYDPTEPPAERRPVRVPGPTTDSEEEGW